MPVENFHADFRKRMRQKVLWDGADSLCDKELLEVILLSIVPNRNAEILAKRLLFRFGCLEKIFAASPQSLMKTAGIGDQTGVFLHALAALYDRLEASKTKYEHFDDMHTLGAYFTEQCSGVPTARTVAVLLDVNGYAAKAPVILPGATEASLENLTKRIDELENPSAVTVAVAQNHMPGEFEPFEDTLSKAETFRKHMEARSIRLMEFFVVAGESYLGIFEWARSFRDLATTPIVQTKKNQKNLQKDLTNMVKFDILFRN